MSRPWSRVFFVEAIPSALDAGDKVILPSSALEEILQNNQDLPSPLTFELRRPHNSSNVVHAGVKEFSGEGDFVQLPAWMLEYLDLSVGSRVLIKLRSLPKGTWTKLRPLSPDYNDIRDYRAALEAHLRAHYNTLTAGQTLTCRYGSKLYPFLVVDLKPEPAVCITDTDLEVDLEATPEQTMQQQQQQGETSAKLNEPIVGVSVEKGAYKYCKLIAENAAASSSSIEVQFTVESGNVDIVISAEDERPTLDSHEYSDFSTASSRQIVLAHSQENKVYHIGIHGYTNAVVSWVAKVPREDDKKDEMDVDKNKAYEKGPGYQCTNCRAWVPEQTFTLHTGFCLRNNVLCPQGCGQVLKKGSWEAEQHWHCEQCEYVGELSDKLKHVEYYHTPKSCICQDFTSDSYEALSVHRRTDCPEKLISCRYCHTLVPQGPPSLDPRDRLLNLHSHESYCGSRTITCQKCHKQIPIKNIQVHAKIHEVERQNQRLPPLCSNRNCVRPRAKNKLGLCQYCFGPFWVTDDDPKNVKLMQRVARKLHSQLTTGCGHAYCRNQFCATGTQKPQDATTAATTLIPMVQSVQRQLSKPSPDPELYLCVDETTTRKKFLAETLVEGTGGQYSIPWCVKALENEDEDLERSKRWLSSNAPKNKI